MIAVVDEKLHSKVQNGNQIKHGERLLPQVIDTWAEEDPGYIVGMMAKSNSNYIPLDFINLSVSQLANAINYTSFWLDETLDTKEEDAIETIAFIGLQDFRYWAMYFASIKTGRRLLLPSPRNALPNTTSLIDTTNCKTLFYSGPLASQAEALEKLIPGLKIFPLPSLDTMIASPTPHYLYGKTWAEAKDDVVMIVHTSGSTGNPKPIFYTNTILSRNDCDVLTPHVAGRQLADSTLTKQGQKCFVGSNFFHLSGIASSTMAFFGRYTDVWGPADQLPSGKIAAEVIKSVGINGMVVVPNVCESLFSDHGEELIPHCAGLEHVCWLGGPLAHSTGEWISSNLPHTKLWQIFGSTETNILPMLVSPSSHWQYMEFHPVIGPTLVHTADPELFEVVHYRHPDPDFAWARPIFHLFPELDEFRSRDLLRRCPDPGFENMSKFEGRVDDMMLLSNGLKVNPVHMEMMLQVHPSLKGALVFGNSHTSCGLLLEPKVETIEREELLTIIWVSVEEANALVPEHARVSRDKLVVATNDRLFARASKGTVVRKLTLALYRNEIEQAYTK
ncbi:Non-canonical non-ribosomal peptide synthetase [Lachnellula subtilissima]|uniref:Non-canonical non-ribosomal peptide synthetase n=1 Tax=Lachnellula subtilissima TaxID=602034 RepID=A0A8H8RV27_9HELO|nr:Non-canonical non-ribosomal peptide synthetase [Lachnellula subtilissima]